jgi:hypothetical protein
MIVYICSMVDHPGSSDVLATVPFLWVESRIPGVCYSTYTNSGSSVSDISISCPSCELESSNTS